MIFFHSCCTTCTHSLIFQLSKKRIILKGNMANKSSTLRSIPPMEELFNTDWTLEYSSYMGREQVKAIISEALDEIRRKLLKNIHDKVSPEVLIAEKARYLLSQRVSGSLKAAVKKPVSKKAAIRKPVGKNLLQRKQNQNNFSHTI